MPVMCSSGTADTDDFAMQMDNYIRSSEVFKSVIVNALNIAISETLKPLQADIKLLKSENEALCSELAEVKVKSNENRQYSRRNTT
jgi:cell shape-determining protein MreC